MRRQVITVLVGLAVGIGLGLLVARSGAVTDGGELTDLRLWLLGAAVLAAFASGPVTGALTGLAAMVGALGTLELTPIVVDGLDDPGLRSVVADLLDDTSWLDPLLLVGAAVAGAAVGAVRLILRTGRRLLLILVAVAVLAAAVLGAPQLSDSPLAPGDGTAVIE